MFRTVFRSDQFSLVRLGALGVAAVLVLGGCTGSGDDADAEAAEGSNRAAPSASASAGASAEADETSETASASPTPIPTPAAAAYKPATAEGPAENVPLPVMPELAKQESKEGLEAFAEYWYALSTYGFETGDTVPTEQNSGPDCVVCKNFYRMVNNGYKDDDWILGGRIIVRSAHSSFVLTSKNQYQVLVDIRQDPLEYRGPSDHLYGVDDGIQEVRVQMIEATFSDGKWYAHNVVTIK